jgi:hypothetical protein
MRTHRFGRKIKLPATIAIKHQIRMLMALDEVKKTEAKPIAMSAYSYVAAVFADEQLPITATNSSGRALSSYGFPRHF